MDALLRKQVKDEVAACTECALHAGCNGPIPFYGPSPSNIAVVGEAPGKYEDIQRRPFVGPAGKLARSWLERTGTDPDDVAWLNVVSCYPKRTPTGNEVAACRGNLRKQLEVVSPNFVLVVGGVASSVWHPLLRIGDLRGRWWSMEPSRIPGIADPPAPPRPPQSPADAFVAEVDALAGNREEPWQGALALATWHPAAVLRNRTLYQQALEDVTYFVMVARGEIGCVLSDRCVMCGGEYDKIENDIAWCLKHYNQKHGLSGGGKPRFKKRKVKDKRLIEVED